ncbi:MAG TPA: hypothetical protein VNG93_11960 [Candidatus Dormibacteraeota bacterium]|nr:hypothetical protein [Candidatus Dormibacteraeota bacterium]
MRSRFAFIWVLLTAAVAGVAAWIAYGAGVATRVASTAPATAAGAPPYYYYGHPGFGFFPFFGFFWLLFLVFVLFWIFRGRRGWGHHRFGTPGGMPPVIDERLKSWHEQAHGDEKKTAQQ